MLKGWKICWPNLAFILLFLAINHQVNAENDDQNRHRRISVEDFNMMMIHRMSTYMKPTLMESGKRGSARIDPDAQWSKSVDKSDFVGIPKTLCFCDQNM